jgi:hypothetical protein
MRNPESKHTLYSAEQAFKVFDKKFLWEFNENIYQDIQKLDRPVGMGIFIKDNLTETNHKGVSVAVICEWKLNPKTQEKKVKFLRYHVYKDEIPDAVLDEINELEDTLKNPVWIKD